MITELVVLAFNVLVKRLQSVLRMSHGSHDLNWDALGKPSIPHIHKLEELIKVRARFGFREPEIVAKDREHFSVAGTSS